MTVDNTNISSNGVVNFINFPTGVEELAKQILSHPDLALIDPICSTTLRWNRKERAVQDMPCDYWDCSRGIKKGEYYYEEEYIEDNQCYTWCIECASYFMAQKLSYIIPLAPAIKEMK